MAAQAHDATYGAKHEGPFHVSSVRPFSTLQAKRSAVLKAWGASCMVGCRHSDRAGIRKGGHLLFFPLLCHTLRLLPLLEFTADSKAAMHEVHTIGGIARCDQWKFRHLLLIGWPASSVRVSLHCSGSAQPFAAIAVGLLSWSTRFTRFASWLHRKLEWFPITTSPLKADRRTGTCAAGANLKLGIGLQRQGGSSLRALQPSRAQRRCR